VILVDTSIWIDHWRNGDERLTHLLESGQVLVHPFVVGELGLGNLLHREQVLTALQDLPQATTATDAEVLGFIDQAALAGSGIGYIDAHLLAAVRLTPGSQLWTRDKRLLAVTARLGLAYAAAH
jgi:predicted nucleic acid-binding protein